MRTPGAVFDDILDERIAQEILWSGPHDWGSGDCSSLDVPPMVKCAVLVEECGEVARAALERDDDALRVELIQVAAVAVAWLQSLPEATP